ncbi:MULTISPECIES: ABC transporter ATP-binding protein [Pseudonocardia]|uniref:Daunorubicin/doxorubicin resistance ATP-binding protein DrrA n=2 Tax=Pseudonocardia TaxID=1847 RepID=A0A1Y2N845_PSEAH|nr:MULTISPECIES: ABC transporter ATP-binding protein [Pseudonocardia]OSY43614.1 Daunorubicin/doxorubicin resistance ATP-binding protein DrrA [Pseudonocardia autotrophica]TDN73395.1 ABC-2 type transport system ATP-binding protein [Pseudonocardia autotrophica]BBG04134.1 multidrug ABC transporter ATP-binding protein [Pseudonocardia autotrophica]GEC25465.1 multidrug ABC transporter ATP-binding protein [Pseudonocardia saturnea]
MRGRGTPGEPVIEVHDLGFRYGGTVAVDGVDLVVHAGEVFGLLGTNGAGKTTTLELVQGFRRPGTGTVRLFGLDPVTAGRAVRRRTGAVLQQAGFLAELTVAETVRMTAALSSRTDDVDDCISRVDLAHRRDVAVGKLSGGERRRLDIATATWGGPELVIMDEPTTGLDPESRRVLWSMVRRMRAGGAAVVLTTHYLEEVEALADRLAIMHAGRVAVAGTLEAVLASRPAAVTAELDPGVPPPRMPGLSTAPAGQGRTTLRLEAEDLTRATYTLTGWALEAGVRLHRLRATEAGLDEVFRAVSGGIDVADPMGAAR